MVESKDSRVKNSRVKASLSQRIVESVLVARGGPNA